MSKDDDSFTEGKLFQPQAHLAKQNENALSMTAPKGQEHTEHDLETVVAAVETILTKYELSHDETNDYVESIMRVVWCQKEGDYERKQYVSTLQRALAAANAGIEYLTAERIAERRLLSNELHRESIRLTAANDRADAAERKLASAVSQVVGGRYLINAVDENRLSSVEAVEVMRKVLK
jgi:phage-related tail protein